MKLTLIASCFVIYSLPVKQDPHDELLNQNVLIVKDSVEETAQKFSLNPVEVKDVLEKCRTLLYKERQNRPRPHLDDKIVAAWNGILKNKTLLHLLKKNEIVRFMADRG